MLSSLLSCRMTLLNRLMKCPEKRSRTDTLAEKQVLILEIPSVTQVSEKLVLVISI